MSSTVRLTSILGFLVLALSACGGSSKEEPTPAVPFPSPGESRGTTTADAREKWGSPCVEEVVTARPFTTRWTYGAEKCGAQWCPAACTKDNGRIYLTFVDFALTDVSEVEQQVPNTTVSIAGFIRNRSQSPRTCTVIASYLNSSGRPENKTLLAETVVASDSEHGDAVRIPAGTNVSLFMSCYAPGQSSVDSASATATVTLKKDCRADGAYVFDPGGVPSLSIAHDC